MNARLIASVFISAAVSKNHVVYYIAKNYRLPISTAKERWATALAMAKSKGKAGDDLFVLSLVHQMRTDPARKAASGPLRILRRPPPRISPSSPIPVTRKVDRKSVTK